MPVGKELSSDRHGEREARGVRGIMWLELPARDKIANQIKRDPALKRRTIAHPYRTKNRPPKNPKSAGLWLLKAR
jgi:hypothetical protein